MPRFDHEQRLMLSENFAEVFLPYQLGTTSVGYEAEWL